ncbi:hypothetical protein KCU67_g63, partial [Aureobasidium melanogenum]
METATRPVIGSRHLIAPRYNGGMRAKSIPDLPTEYSTKVMPKRFAALAQNGLVKKVLARSRERRISSRAVV